jgi:hypothetical protein
VNQSKQITAVPLRQAHSSPAAHLALVHDNSMQSARPAPYTAEWARAVARACGESAAETRRFVAWVCSLQGTPVPSRSHLRVVR